MVKKVAIVTGSNKGIGYAVVKGLCEKFEGDVYLTARVENRGIQAIEKLNQLGYNPKFHQLDITIPESVEKLRDYLKLNYGGIDVLVNNAGTAFKENATEPFSYQAQETLKVNYFGLLNACTILFPILKPHARVVNVSSSYGHLLKIPGLDLRKQLSADNLTEDGLSNLMNSFINATKSDMHTAIGWPNSAYAVSKVGVSALTRIQQKKIAEDKERPDIIINHVHPGYVDTDMSSHKGPLTIEEGAESSLFAALLPENTKRPKGDFIWRTKVVVDWVNGPVPSYI